jgi:hypothetical protein
MSPGVGRHGMMQKSDKVIALLLAESSLPGVSIKT